MSPHRTAVVRILDAIAAGWRAALARWRAGAAVPVVERKCTSFFGCDPDTLHAALPRDADEEESKDWHWQHFRINGQPWDGKR